MYLSDRFGSSRESWPTYKGKWNQTETELNKTIQKCWVNISLLVCVCMCVCFELFPYEVPTGNTIKELIPVLPFLLGRISYPIAWIPATVVHIPFQGCREYRKPSPASCDSRAYGWLGEYPFTLEARGQYLWVWEMPKQRLCFSTKFLPFCKCRKRNKSSLYRAGIGMSRGTKGPSAPPSHLVCLNLWDSHLF